MLFGSAACEDFTLRETVVDTALVPHILVRDHTSAFSMPRAAPPPPIAASAGTFGARAHAAGERILRCVRVCVVRCRFRFGLPGEEDLAAYLVYFLRVRCPILVTSGAMCPDFDHMRDSSRWSSGVDHIHGGLGRGPSLTHCGGCEQALPLLRQRLGGVGQSRPDSPKVLEFGLSFQNPPKSIQQVLERRLPSQRCHKFSPARF